MTSSGNAYLANEIDQIYSACTPIEQLLAVRCCGDESHSSGVAAIADVRRRFHSLLERHPQHILA